MTSASGEAAATATCRWWPKMGDAELCATTPGGEAEFSRLRSVYPLFASAMWLAVLALFLQVLGLPRSAWLRVAATWSVTLTTGTATALMLACAGNALAVVGGSPISFSGIGFVLALAATLLSLASGALEFAHGRLPARSLAVALLLFTPTGSTFAQGRGADSTVPSACWRFAFGAWTPALDWSRAGHVGDASATASAVRRIRDSVFAKDSAASASNAMTWDRTSRGWLVVLYPPWWPAGVEVTFDSTLTGGTAMLGTAVAMVANAGESASRARARAWRC